MQELQKIGFGGGCHWCTEAVFQLLYGVYRVEQGFIASNGTNSLFSEGVIVHYKPIEISISNLIAIHLHTHNSTVNHSMRNKYRSAVYTFSNNSESEVLSILKKLQMDFKEELITQVLPFCHFRPSDVKFQNYYKTDKERPFCQTHITPKLKLILNKFSAQVKPFGLGSCLHRGR